MNCAGVLNVTKANELEYNKVAQLFKLNVIAPMILVSKLFDKIKANEADIVNVGSTLGFKAYQEQAAYGSSK
ncbi:MAG: SDR family NAD(P)-dependent oxidoreductase [Candidatus Dojkabacteria bacterium]|nr:SDR family NAD(P)-dependent oxidoreductase [Candidatus Dojkabacteria bacterium]